MAKNVQNRALHRVDTEFHWLKEAYGTASCVLFFLESQDHQASKVYKQADPGAVNNAVRLLHCDGDPKSTICTFP